MPCRCTARTLQAPAVTFLFIFELTTASLAGVRPLLRDGTRSYFNDDNEANLSNCLRLPNETYSLFLEDDKHYDVAFRTAPEAMPPPVTEVGLASRDGQRTSWRFMSLSCTPRRKSFVAAT